MRIKRITIFFRIGLIFSLPIMLLLTTVELSTFNLDFYESKYKEYNIMNSTKINKYELLFITKEMLDYLRNKRDNIEIYATIGDNKEQVFGEREKLHMVDVKKLFQKGFLIRNIFLITSMISLIFLIKFDRKKLKKVMTITLVYPLVMISILFILLYFDFYKYFTCFHLIFFDNDLWMLNPETDVLIQMLPLELFYSIAYRIIVYFVGSLIFILLISKLRIKEKRIY